MSEKENNFLKKNEKLTDDEIYRVVKESANLGIKKIRITGGEPLYVYLIISKKEDYEKEPCIYKDRR